MFNCLLYQKWSFHLRTHLYFFLFISFQFIYYKVFLFVKLNACKRLKSAKFEVFFVRWSEFSESTRDTYSCFSSVAHFIIGDSSTHLWNLKKISGSSFLVSLFLYLTHLMHRNRKKRRTKRFCGPNLCGAFHQVWFQAESFDLTVCLSVIRLALPELNFAA